MRTSSRCLAGPWSAADQAGWKSAMAVRDAGPSSSRPLGSLHGLDDSRLFDEVTSRLTDKEVFRGIASMTAIERTIHHVYWLMVEVNNGGFYQYFFNSAGNCAQATTAALRELRVPELEALYARVLAKFPGGPPPEDRSARQEALDRLRDTRTWDADDTAFGRIEVSRPLERYAREHLAELDLPPRR